MRKSNYGRFVPALGLSVLALLLMVFSGCKDPVSQAEQLQGKVTGPKKANAGAAVWKQLGKYERVYLKSWKGAFAESNPPAGDVLDAFNEVAYAVTGPSGFWRDRVPNRWFGCKANPNSPTCRALSKASKAEFAAWDKLQTKISGLSPSKQKAFLAKNGKKMLRYLKTYVPTKPSASAMKRTGFYKKHLRKAMQIGASAHDSAGDL